MKSKINSKWKSSYRRQEINVRIHDGRWVPVRGGSRLSLDSAPIRGKFWRYEEDTCSEVEWCDRRKEWHGWRHGAKINAVTR